MCRPCAVEIRYGPLDVDWVTAQFDARDAGPRDLQLALILDGVGHMRAQSLRKHDRPLARPRLDKLPPWMRARLPGPVAADDPAVCPPQIPGQLVLLRPRRSFTLDDANRIRDRQIPDMQAAQAAIRTLADERGLDDSSCRAITRMARLALAARDPDEHLVREEDLDPLPEQRRNLAEALRRAALLRPRPGGPAARLPPRPRASRRDRQARPPDPPGSCKHCLAWSGDTKRICVPCQEWAGKHPVGSCRRCRRDVPLKTDLCRFCHLVLAEHADEEHPVDQLWFGGDLAIQLRDRRPGGRYGRAGRRGIRRREAASAREARRPVSEHLVDPAQLMLFEGMRRDWSRVDITALPALTEPAQHLLDELEQLARTESWIPATRQVNMRTLRVLLAWLGAAAPIPEADVTAVAMSGDHYGGQRVVQFLGARGMLAPDPARHADADQLGVDRLLASLPEHLLSEVTAWIRVLRGEGHRPSPVMSWQTIRRYLGYVTPVLHQWGTQVDSLRSITSHDVEAALKERPGRARNLQIGLRSLFRALKRERLIFRDPARGVSLPSAERLPTPLPSDRLRGLIDKAPTSAAKLAVALVAIHALGATELQHLRLDQLDRAHGRLTLHRPGRDHTVFLDELTLRLAAGWLRERARRWPRSTNPHLFVSQQTAADDRRPMSRFGIASLFAASGIPPRQLRADRILDEAHHTADPVHLMRTFGICTTTAIKYVKTAHPERFTIDPTQA